MNEPFSNDEEFTRGAFSSLEPVEPSASLLRRVAEIPIQHPRAAKKRLWPFETLWQPVLGWALAGTLGVVVGTSGWDEVLSGSLHLTAESSVEAPSSASTREASLNDEAGATDESLEEFLALAWGPETRDASQWSLEGDDTSP